MFRLKNNLKSYCSNSSVHGLRYLSEAHRPAHEKRFWLLMICVSITVCSSMIWQVYDKWERSPVIVSIAEKPSPISEIPFPAVTICPINKVKRSVFNYTKVYHSHLNEIRLRKPIDLNLSFNDQIIYANIAHICANYIKDTNLTKYLVTFDSLVRIMDYVSSRFLEDSVCVYKGVDRSCSDFFQEVITGEGLCYTFNGLSNDDMFRRENIDPSFLIGKHNVASSWTIEDGFAKNDTYPRTSHSTASHFSLQVHLRSLDVDQDYVCQGPLEGFRVFIHSPSDYPRASQKTSHVEAGLSNHIAVKPLVVQTLDDLRAYPPERRQCYFNNERYLRFFKVYSQYNCEIECFANTTLTACGCVHFSMPRSADTPICKMTQNESACISFAVSSAAQQRKFNLKEYKCNCLPSCSSLTYEVKQTRVKLNVKKLARVILLNDQQKFTKLYVAFKETHFIASKRKTLYGTIDFVAYCGGLLGLCMGISLLSFIELIYFWSFRLRTSHQEGRGAGSVDQ